MVRWIDERMGKKEWIHRGNGTEETKGRRECVCGWRERKEGSGGRVKEEEVEME